MSARRDPAAYAADVLAAHYDAVRAALEAARTTETGSGPNRYAAALEALDGAVFGLGAAFARCARCGAEIIPVNEDATTWRHAPRPDPVTEFLNEDHEANPRKAGGQ
jgi:hypothetical protein